MKENDVSARYERTFSASWLEKTIPCSSLFVFFFLMTEQVTKKRREEERGSLLFFSPVSSFFL